MADHDQSYIDAASELWNEAKRDYPKTALVASMFPVTGEITSALELNDAYNRGDKADMGLAAVGLLPGGTLLKDGVKAAKAGERAAAALRRSLPTAESPAAFFAATRAADAQVARGYKKAGAGAATEAANTGLNVRDYVRNQSQGDREYSEAWGRN